MKLSERVRVRVSGVPCGDAPGEGMSVMGWVKVSGVLVVENRTCGGTGCVRVDVVSEWALLDGVGVVGWWREVGSEV